MLPGVAFVFSCVFSLGLIRFDGFSLCFVFAGFSLSCHWLCFFHLSSKKSAFDGEIFKYFQLFFQRLLRSYTHTTSNQANKNLQLLPHLRSHAAWGSKRALRSNHRTSSPHGPNPSSSTAQFLGQPRCRCFREFSGAQ